MCKVGVLFQTDDASLSDEEFSSHLGYFQEACETTSLDSVDSHTLRERKYVVIFFMLSVFE